MDELPEYAFPIVFSFMGTGQTHRCACASKEWYIYAKKRLVEIRIQAAQRRVKAWLD